MKFSLLEKGLRTQVKEPSLAGFMPYAALSYLDEWMTCDCEARRLIGDATEYTPEVRECMVRFATRYGVMRTLGTQEESRLEAATHALLQVEAPASRCEVASIWRRFAEQLQSEYGGGLKWSAASKLLWVRFGTPMVIYDSLADGWLRKHGGLKGSDENGEEYVGAWCNVYTSYAPAIESACASLSRVKEFTLASSVSQSDLQQWVQQESFRERVFDHALLTAQSLSSQA